MPDQATPIEDNTSHRPTLQTDQDWDDLVDMISHFTRCTDWLLIDRQRADYERRSPEHLAVLDRQSALAARIIDAVGSSPSDDTESSDLRSDGWQPTHRSVDDGSVVRCVSDSPFVVENEDGEQWEADPDQWAPSSSGPGS